jgi:hypothetical protein
MHLAMMNSYSNAKCALRSRHYRLPDRLIVKPHSIVTLRTSQKVQADLFEVRLATLCSWSVFTTHLSSLSPRKGLHLVVNDSRMLVPARCTDAPQCLTGLYRRCLYRSRPRSRTSLAGTSTEALHRSGIRRGTSGVLPAPSHGGIQRSWHYQRTLIR